jgi:hypothetical protein
MKRCNNCKKQKDESEFGKQLKNKDGLKYWCKNCVREITRRHYKKDRGRVKRYFRYEERHRVVDGVKEKQCRRCKKWKAESEFHKRYKHKDGLAVWCKSCARESSRRYYKKNMGRVKRYYRYEERHRVVDGVKEKRCCRCKKWKAESEFYKRYGHKDGLTVWCKGCSDKAVIKSRKRRPAVWN